MTQPKQSSLKSDIEGLLDKLDRWYAGFDGEEDDSLDPDEATQALLNKIENIGIEIIGGDDIVYPQLPTHLSPREQLADLSKTRCNELRAAQRTKLKQIIGGSKT